MKIEVSRIKNIAVLNCSGSLDSDTVSGFKRTTQALVDEGTIRIIIDSGALTFVDSMGLGAMISLLRQVKQRGGDVRIANVTQDVKSIFEITRLHRIFDICKDVKDACVKFDGALP